MRYRFGLYILDTTRRELLRTGTSIPLAPKSYQVLVYLVEHRDRLVIREELLEAVWPDIYVDTSAVARHVGLVRKAVGDSRQRQQVIVTRPKQGYRFIAEVVTEDADMVSPISPEPSELLSPVPQDVAPEPLEPLVPCRHCGEAVTLGALYCSACGRPLTPAEATSEVAADDADSTYHVMAGERKPVTVLCMIIDTATPLDLDCLDDVLEALKPFVERVVGPYGGYLYSATSDGLELFFGLPETQEDHAQRAVLAALALQQQWDDFIANLKFLPELKLTFRMGVHTGLVVVKPFHGAQEMTPTVVGNVAAMAAEAARQADIEQIVVSSAVALLVRDVVALEKQLLTTMVQPSSLMPYYCVMSRHHGVEVAVDTSWGDEPRRRLVGREEELGLLQTYFDRAVAEHGQVIGIMGPPGMGKSRLLRAFRPHVRAAGAQYLMGCCRSYGAVTPYAVVGEIVQQWFGILESDDASTRSAKVSHGCRTLNVEPATILSLWGAEDATKVEATPPPAQVRSQLFSALHQMIAMASQHQPLVLVIEDLHWVDPSSEAYLMSLVERLDRLPLLFLVTYRSGYQPPWATWAIGVQMALAPLSSAESVAVMQEVFQHREVADTLRREIEAKAQGNSLFLEELARSVVEQEEAETGTLAVPDAVQTVLAARIDRLSPEAKSLLQTAAVFGPEVPLAPLQAVMVWSQATLEEGLSQLRTAAFLYESQAGLEPV